jgi:hypothetical protein
MIMVYMIIWMARVITRPVTRLSAIVVVTSHYGEAPMSTATITRAETQADVRDRTRDVLADMLAAHLEAASIVAELDLDDTHRWAHASELVGDLSAETYGVIAALTGQPGVVTAPGVAPIVRVREFAIAQRQLFGVLDGRGTLDAEATAVMRASVDRITAALRLLRSGPRVA